MILGQSTRQKLFDTNIENYHVLLTPHEVKSKLPLTSVAEANVLRYRQELKDILDFQNKRKFIVIGPCSIHNTELALEYTRR